MGTNNPEVEFPHRKLPNRRSLLFHQTLIWLEYICLTFVVLLITVLYLILLTIVICPLALCMRKCSEIPGYFVAPIRLHYEIFRRYRYAFKTREADWDFEMGKPRPLAQQKRGPVSYQRTMLPQSQCGFIRTLPAELRIEIYNYVITGNSTHVHIAVHRMQRPGGKGPYSRIHGYPCREQYREFPVTDCKCFECGYQGQPRPHLAFPTPEDSGRGLLALSRTCRLIYTETIDRLYNLQTFYFNSLSQPPFFLHSIPPTHLATIRNIQLCYNQSFMKAPCTPTARRAHEFQHCNPCNVNLWLHSIGKMMTGLRTIEVFIYLEKGVPVPTTKADWITRLLQLQYGANGLRELNIRVFAHSPSGGYPPLPRGLHHVNPTVHAADVARYDRSLQDMIKKGIELHFYQGRAVEPASNDEISGVLES